MSYRRRNKQVNYSEEFYDGHKIDSLSSAEIIVPWLIELFNPQSIVDVGCGSGVWLSVFQRSGLKDFLGLDGSWVQSEQLEIPPAKFRQVELDRPFNLEQKFDLVVSLEVAEHLPSPSAEQFVSSLTKLGPAIVFSAAIPYQGGTGHVNERWPSYWIKMFKKEGYSVVDCLRGRFWYEEKIAPWYIQNVFFFIHEDCLDSYPSVSEAERKYSMSCKPLVHPRQFTLRVEELSNPQNYSLRKIALAVPSIMKRSLTTRLSRYMK